MLSFCPCGVHVIVSVMRHLLSPRAVLELLFIIHDGEVVRLSDQGVEGLQELPARCLRRVHGLQGEDIFWLMIGQVCREPRYVTRTASVMCVQSIQSHDFHYSLLSQTIRVKQAATLVRSRNVKHADMYQFGTCGKRALLSFLYRTWPDCTSLAQSERTDPGSAELVNLAESGSDRTQSKLLLLQRFS